MNDVNLALTNDYSLSKCSLIFILTIDFLMLKIKIYNNELPSTLPSKLLHNTTKTVTGRALYPDYPLAFNINLKMQLKIPIIILIWSIGLAY